MNVQPAGAPDRTARTGGRRGAGAGALRRLMFGEAGPAPALVLAGVALVIAFITIAGPRALVSADNRAASQAVAQAPAVDRGALISADWQAGPGAAVLGAGTIQALGSAFAADLPSRRQFPAAQRWAGFTVPRLVVQNAAPSAVDQGPPVAEVGYRTELARYCVVVAGSLPTGPAEIRPAAGRAPASVTLGVAATTATAARFSLRVGSVMELGTARSGDPQIRLLVTGIVRPTAAASSFWQFDPVFGTPELDGGPSAPYWYGGLLTGSADLPGLGVAYARDAEIADWFFPLSPALSAAAIPRLESELAALAAAPTARNTEVGLNAAALQYTAVTSGLADGLAAFTAQWHGTEGADSLLIVGLTVAGLILLLVCAGLAAEAYRSELVLLRVRGGSLAQLTRRTLLRSCSVTLPGLAIGAVLAIVVLPGGGSPASWILGGVSAVTAVAGAPVICVLAHRRLRFAAAARRTDLIIGRPSVRRMVAELIVLLVAGAAVADVRLRGAGSGTTVPYLSASAVLVAAVVAVAVNRAYRGPLRALATVALTRRGPVSAVGMARAATARAGSLLPALALILTLTLAAFGTMVLASISAGQVAASWAQVGADAVISVNGSAGVTSAELHVMERVTGVRHATAVYTAPSQGVLAVVLANGNAAGPPIGLAVVDPIPYAALSADTPWSGFPAGALAPPRSGSAAVVPILATPGVAAGTVAGQTRLEFGGLALPVRIVGTITDTAAMPAGGSYVVLPSWAAGRLPSIPPATTVLLTGSAISAPELSAAAARVLPGSQLTFRRQVLSALASSPALHMSDGLYLVGALAAAALSALAAAFALAASARSRSLMMTRLAALGMARRQALVLGLTDAIPLLSVAAIGTAVSSWLLAEVVGPALGLAVFTGSSVPVPLRPAWLELILPLAGIAVLTLSFLTIDGMRSGRREIGTALRQEETV